jgi:hypothetical protein
MTRFIAFLVLSLLPALSCAASMDPDISAFTHWRYVLDHERFTAPGTPFGGNLKPVLDALQERYHAVPYRTSAALYGDKRHWATREETRKRKAADCKGVAEAELFDLLEMGVPDTDVEIVVADVKATGETHAVTRAQNWVLDIRAARVLTLDEFREHYTPIYAINRIGWRYLAGSI